MENQITVEYNGSVITPAGYRGVTYTAVAEKISEKRCVVMRVIEIDGKPVVANMSRTGAARQKFYGIWEARNQQGKIKNLSSCTIV